MPARKDISKILVIGSGPIIIGQACEFDYSGSQACKALKKEGYEVVLINSNPATIMTDPEFADKTYIEPIDKEIVKKQAQSWSTNEVKEIIFKINDLETSVKKNTANSMLFVSNFVSNY